MTRSADGDSSVGIDGRGHAVVGIAQNPATIFDGTHPSHIQVLPRRACVAVPAIVGDVDEDLGSIHGELAYFIGKDRFIADEDTEGVSTCAEDLAILAAVEVVDLLSEVFREEEDIAVRDVFAKRHEMNLVVAANDIAVGRSKGR